jgi:predicted Zn-dependent protease
MIRAAASICEKSRLSAAGSFHTGEEAMAVMNSAGLFAFNSHTNSRFSCTAISEDSSGKSEVSNEDVTRINPESIASFAVDRAVMSRSPREIEPGQYTVILEPPAVAEILAFMMWGFDARAAHEGRSFKEGVKMVHASVNIHSRPGHEMVPGRPFNEDGLPCPEMHWVRAGVVENLHYGRYWARKCGRAPTGYPSNLIMDGGKATLDEMIASTKRGVLVSRFWYVRHVDWMAMLLTGMTRDGTFLIEDGRIVGGVRNMRFNDSPARLLGAVEMLGPQRRCGEWFEMLVPTIKASGFNFTSKTRF